MNVRHFGSLGLPSSLKSSLDDAEYTHQNGYRKILRKRPFYTIWRIKDTLLSLKKSQLKPMLGTMTIFFLVLGLSWIFGLFHILLAENHYPNVFSYLFVLSTLIKMNTKILRKCTFTTENIKIECNGCTS